MSEYKLIFKINKIWFMSKKYGVQIQFIKALVKVKDKEESNVEFIEYFLNKVLKESLNQYIKK